MTVISDSACNSPADSSVCSSSTNNPSAMIFTLRISPSMGSAQCFLSWSIAFNSSIVFVGTTSTVRTPPSKVFTFTSQGMAAIAARNHRRLWCLSLKCAFWQRIWKFPQLWDTTLHNYWGLPNRKQECFIPQDFMSFLMWIKYRCKTWKKQLFEGKHSPFI